MLRTIRRRFRLLGFITVVLVIASILSVKFATAPEYRLYALNAASGKIAWSTAVDMNWSSYSVPVIDNGRVIIATNDASPDARTEHWQIDAYDAETGHALWT